MVKSRDFCVFDPVVDFFIDFLANVVLNVGVIELNELKVVLGCGPSYIVEAELVCNTTGLDTSVPVLPDLP